MPCPMKLDIYTALSVQHIQGLVFGHGPTMNTTACPRTNETEKLPKTVRSNFAEVAACRRDERLNYFFSIDKTAQPFFSSFRLVTDAINVCLSIGF